MERKRIAITMRAPAGIGPEVIIKVLSDEDVYKKCIPVVIGNYETLQDAVGFSELNLVLREINEPSEAEDRHGTVEFINLNYLKRGSWKYKENSGLGGGAAFQYVIRGIEYAKKGIASAFITAPINK